MQTVTEYHFGKIVIDGTTYTSDVIIFPDHVQSGWWRAEGHRLAVADLEDVLQNPPEILVVGTGKFGMMKVPDETAAILKEKNIELRAMRTGKAWQELNRAQASHNAVGAFHLTC